MASNVSEQGHELLDLSWTAGEPRLKGCAIAAADAMGVKCLQELIAGHARFDQSGTVYEPDGTTREAPHYRLELLLGAMPAYMAYADQAGLSSDQASELVHTILMAEKRSEHSFIYESVIQLCRVFDGYINRKETLTGEDYTILRNLVEDTADNEADSNAAIDAYRALARLGLSAVESAALIRNELFADSAVINYALWPLNALSVASVDSRLLTEICHLIPGEALQLSEIQASYATLYDLITNVCPGEDVAPNDFLGTVRDRLAAGCTMADIALQYITGDKQTLEGDAHAQASSHRRDSHFIETTGPLELSPLPYRSERSFSEGAADIGRIAQHSARHREAIGEGLWVFDAEAPIPSWYSLGGETEVDWQRRAVRLRYPSYPLAEISRRLIVYHAHPVELEYVTRPPDHVFPQIAISSITKFLAATPSRRDYAMIAELMRASDYEEGMVRAFIAHGSGATEYSFPNDPDAIEAVGETFQTQCDAILNGVNWEKILFERKWRGLVKGSRKDISDVIGELIDRLNAAMPKGFQLHFLAPGVQITL